MSKNAKKKTENNATPRYDADAVYKAFQDKGFSVSHLKKHTVNAHETSVSVEKTTTVQDDEMQQVISEEKTVVFSSRPHKKNQPITFVPPAGGLEPNQDSVICPICYTFLPSSVISVKAHTGKTLPMKVGYCKKCKRHYSDNVLARKHKLITAKKPRHIITWSNVQFRKSAPPSAPTPYEFVSLNGKQLSKEHISAWFDYIKAKYGNRQIIKASRVEKSPNPNTFSIKKTVFQIPLLGENTTKCPYCHRESDGFLPISYAAYATSGYVSQYTNVRSCRKCEVIFLEDNQFKQIQSQAKGRYVYSVKTGNYSTPTQLMTVIFEEPKLENPKNSLIPLPFGDYPTGKVNLSTESKVISIYPQTCHCHKCREKFGVETITNRTAIVQTVSGELVDVNVMFCQGCGSYFMNIKSFEHYKKLYGGLLFECTLSSDFNKNQYSWFDFAPDSILSRCGYTVKEGVTKEYRQAILRYILENEKATKYEIIEHISGFINLRDSLPQYSGACQRWREDISFVNSFQIQKQKKVYGLSFAQGGNIK